MKLRIVFFALFGIYTSIRPEDKVSQTMFVPRCIVTDAVYDHGLNNYRFSAYTEERFLQHSKKSSMFSIQPTYVSSGKSEDLARYFLLNNKITIRFKENPDSTSDIASEHFGLIGAQVTSNQSSNPSRGPFDSTLSIRPKRSLYGVILGVHGNLDHILNGVFVEARVPILHVRHELNMEESNKNALSTNSPSTIINALNQSDWIYGRFDAQRMVKEGVDDLLFRFGYNYVDRNRFNGSLYGDVIVPLGDGPTAKYIFEPLIGSSHIGLGFGSSIDWQFYCGEIHKISIIGDARFHYRFTAKELRSFDLKANGPWSRYLLLSRRSGVKPLDGINFFTRDVDVLPRSSLQLFGALHYQLEYLHVEGGYNLYYRERESVELHDNWDQESEDVGIYAETAYINRTASALTINSKASSSVDSTFIRIKESDFDLRSASHESVLSHKIFLGISVQYLEFDYPGRIGIGTSYEFGESNTALNQWSFWFNITVQF